MTTLSASKLSQLPKPNYTRPRLNSFGASKSELTATRRLSSAHLTTPRKRLFSESELFHADRESCPKMSKTDNPDSTPDNALMTMLASIKAEIGNPHFLVQVDEVDSFDLESFSKKVVLSNTFLDGVNVEIYQIINDNFIKTRVFERGVGETDACGSGALCLFNYLYSENKVSNPTTILFPGGELDLEFKNEELFLSGTVTYL